MVENTSIFIGDKSVFVKKCDSDSDSYGEFQNLVEIIRHFFYFGKTARYKNIFVVLQDQ